MAVARAAIISASVGAGHDGAARELGRRLSGLGLEVCQLDLVHLLPARLGPTLRRAYAMQLAVAPRSWAWLLSALAKKHVGSTAAAMAARTVAARMLTALTPTPDVVVSTYPGASQVLGSLRGSGRLAAPIVTFLTDMSVHPMWVSPGVDLHIAVHHVPAYQAARLGGQVAITSAAVDPAFHPHSTNVERETVRRRYGIPTDRPVALVVAGSWGVGQIEATMRDIAASRAAVPVAVCGANRRLRRRLAAIAVGPALGWVDDMAPLMRACDVVVQNSGGLTSLEARAAGVPMVSYRCLPGHGSANSAALEEAGWARWPRDPASLAPCLRAAIAAGAASIESPAADPAAVIAGVAGVRVAPYAAARGALVPSYVATGGV